LTGEITISLWLFIVLIAVAVIAVLDRVLIPSSRWFLRRRINRVIEEIGTRLDIEIRPFQLTKRQVLVDRLVYDPIVINAVRDYAREHEMPVEIVQDKVAVYAREIVPFLQRLFLLPDRLLDRQKNRPHALPGARRTAEG
jgi:glycerol-3-phosphate O-acyltransferase